VKQDIRLWSGFSWLRKCPVAGYFDETMGSTIGGEFYDQLSNCNF
jgi:hypothetical protein